MGNAGTRKVTVVLQFAAINFSILLTRLTPQPLSHSPAHTGIRVPAHAYPMKRTIYLSHRVGFLTNLKPTCRGIAFGIPYWATF